MKGWMKLHGCIPTVDAVERDRAYVGLPKRLRLNHVLRNTPSAITKLALKGVKVGPQLDG